MSQKRDQLRDDNCREFDEQDEKDPTRMFNLFTTDKLDRKVYWFFLLFLLIFYMLTNIPVFFRRL